MRPIRVLIADDHPEMLSAIVSVLGDDPRFCVAGTATTGAETLEAARTVGVDVVLLDVNMPGGGAEAATELTSLTAAPVVVAVSAHVGGENIEDLLRAGAVGYLAKGRLGDTLPDDLARCMEGEVVLASPAAAGALRTLLRRLERHPRGSPPDQA